MLNLSVMGRGTRSDRRGALLGEILLAFSLLLLVAVFMSSVFPYSYSADQKAWKRSSAYRLAETRLEELRGKKFDEIVDASYDAVVEKTPYKVRVTVKNPPDESAPYRSKIVTCEVTWKTPNGLDRYVQEARIARLLTNH